ncbi:hypothetical protein [Cupriavidus sp. TMH.W2]|uniref:hypothetical protein n=1 Tax=Cupriavidus sp. TMH.W2 TaxID=3434465 RepID=UPI003D788B11
MTQGEFLRAAQEVLGLTRDEFADRLGMKKRSLDNWYLPPESKEFRSMHDEARSKIHSMLQEEAEKRPGQSDWQAGCKQILAAAANCDFVRLDWHFAQQLAKDYQSVADNLVVLYAAPIAAWLAEADASVPLGVAMQPLADRLERVLAANPRMFPSKERLTTALKGLPSPAMSRRRYHTFDELLAAYKTKLEHQK